MKPHNRPIGHHLKPDQAPKGTEYTAIVTPSFDGINIRIIGRDRNQVKDYLHDVLSEALGRPYESPI